MIKPLGSRVLLMKHIDDHKVGSIIVTSLPTDKFQGVIEAKGYECSDCINVGDSVQYERYQGTPVEEDRLIMDEKFILAVIS